MDPRLKRVHGSVISLSISPVSPSSSLPLFLSLATTVLKSLPLSDVPCANSCANARRGDATCILKMRSAASQSQDPVLTALDMARGVAAWLCVALSLSLHAAASRNGTVCDSVVSFGSCPLVDDGAPLNNDPVSCECHLGCMCPYAEPGSAEIVIADNCTCNTPIYEGGGGGGVAAAAYKGYFGWLYIAVFNGTRVSKLPQLPRVIVPPEARRRCHLFLSHAPCTHRRRDMGQCCRVLRRGVPSCARSLARWCPTVCRDSAAAAVTRLCLASLLLPHRARCRCRTPSSPQARTRTWTCSGRSRETTAATRTSRRRSRSASRTLRYRGGCRWTSPSSRRRRHRRRRRRRRAR